MGDQLQETIRAATEAGTRLVEAGHMARAAAYEPATSQLRLDLVNGTVVRIPVALIEGLSEASDEIRAEVEVAGIGHGLHWPSLDLDLSVPGLLAEVFGTRRWMNRQRAARAGAARSPTKADAARRNGAKGGRPRKIAQQRDPNP